jgi:hypothetical protein
MRFKTALVAEGWMNLVVSLVPMEKLCQLMIELAELVMVMVLFVVVMFAVPFAICGRVGRARAAVGRKEASMNAAAIRLWFLLSLKGVFIVFLMVFTF